jgi:mono/diheme cytochrome c family protein
MIFMMNAIRMMPYLAPTGLSNPIPLERYLPNYPAGVIKQYFENEGLTRPWIFDPFGSNPSLDLEASKAGKKVLVACNNPILEFLLRVVVNPPQKKAMLTVLSDIASQTSGNERLETHIKSVYQTRCVVCHTLIQASGYLWRRAEAAPYARIYHCPICGNEGEYPISDEDIEIIQPLQRGEPIHQARALSRVLHGRTEERPAVMEALKVYNSRSLYVIFTLLNKLEGMRLDPEESMLSDAMMISLLDAGTSLWTWPELTDQPRQLTLPQVYFEKNLWMELEHCIDLWSQPLAEIELTTWPALPSGAGICLFPGPVRNLESLPKELEFGGLICVPPRPNQAFWTLSALWSAWLWGRDETHSFNQVLGRRRFDWHWHTLALQQAFEKAAALIPGSIPVFTQIGEPSTGMVFAVNMASHLAGFRLDKIAFSSPNRPIQTLWQTRQRGMKTGKANPQAVVREAIRSVLLQRGEPTDYLLLYTAAVSGLVEENGFPGKLDEYTQEKTTELHNLIVRLFNDQEFLRRYEATSQELESGKWGLIDWQTAQAPLSERVERTLAQLLRDQNSISNAEIRGKLNSDFPGFQTPENELVEYCLAAYADWDSAAFSWKCRSKETIQNRQKDLENARKAVIALGKCFEYDCSGEQPILWRDGDATVFRFFFSTTTGFSQLGIDEEDKSIESVLVFPGSRAVLLKYKLMNDPRLHEMVAHHWHFLKFRALKALSTRGDLTRPVWKMQLDSDPINFEEMTQLRIFG